MQKMRRRVKRRRKRVRQKERERGAIVAWSEEELNRALRRAHKFAVWKMVSFIVGENERLIDVNIRSDSVSAAEFVVPRQGNSLSREYRVNLHLDLFSSPAPP